MSGGDFIKITKEKTKKEESIDKTIQLGIDNAW